MPGNFSGGSFSGASGGLSVDAEATATPGRVVRNLGLKATYKVEDETEKLARRVREGTIQAPPVPAVVPTISPSDRYIKKSARLASGISKLRAEADSHREEIAKLERALETAKVRKALLRAQQALQLATVQEAVLIEEMEVLDIAFLAHVSLRMTIQ